jgi:methionine synthase II (cobalamin-independent)
VPAVEPAYETALLAELDEITAAVPHDELAVQWDAAVEFGMLEGVWPVKFTDVRREVLDRLVRIGNRVPADVELGYHLCYGDAGHKHFKEPADVSKLVDIANAITSGVQRPVQWISLPVPRDRADDAYFAPLRELRLPAETELYLGLVHITDGVEGTERRIAAAQRAIDRPFGVATECGLGRRPPETIPQLLRIHAEVSAPVGEPVKAT